MGAISSTLKCQFTENHENEKIWLFGETEHRRPGVYKVAQCVSAHFCLVKTPSIALDNLFLVGWGGVGGCLGGPEFLAAVLCRGGKKNYEFQSQIFDLSDFQFPFLFLLGSIFEKIGW